VVVGSAMDIVKHCGVARYCYSDFPLGNPCGKPGNKGMQLAIIKQALGLFESAQAPDYIERTAHSWSADDSWREGYAKVDDTNREELRLRGEARRAEQAADKAAGNSRAAMIAES
jgi:D-proline reductase (dithiol) PrdB